MFQVAGCLSHVTLCLCFRSLDAYLTSLCVCVSGRWMPISRHSVFVFQVAGCLSHVTLCLCFRSLDAYLTSLCVCVSGRWIFGNVLCQGFAFVSHLLVGGAAWLIALAGLER